MPNYEEVIQQSEANIKSLSEKLKDLDKLHQDIKELIKQPAKGIKLSRELEETTKSYLEAANSLFTKKINSPCVYLFLSSMKSFIAFLSFFCS